MIDTAKHIEAIGAVLRGHLTGTACIASENEGAAFRLHLCSGGDTLTTVVRAEVGRFVDFYTDGDVYADFLRAHEGAQVQFTIDRQ